MATYSSKTELNGSKAPTGLGVNYSTQGTLSTFTFNVNGTSVKTWIEVDSGGGQNNISLVGSNGTLAFYNAQTNTWSAPAGQGNKTITNIIIPKISSTPGLANALSQSAYYTTYHKTGNATQATQITKVSPSTPTPTVAPPAQGLNGSSPQNQPGAGFFDLQKNVAGITTQFGQIQFKKGQTFQYPKDALYTKGKNAQDHLTISKYSYKAPYGDDIFKQNKADEILTKGLTRGSALKEFLGMVIMPMPNSISDSNNVSWGDDSMNNLTAAATNIVASDVAKTLGAAALGATVGGLLNLLTGAGSASGGASAGVSVSVYKDLINAIMKSDNANAKTIGGAAGASKLLSMAGFSVSPESILARGAGIIPNSNLELLFNSPTLREFTFQYRMSPRGKEEAREINNIIRFFKQGMAAKKQGAKSGAGAASYFLGTPDVFQLSYRTTNNSPIKGVNRIKTCALTGFAMNYAADGNWAAYDEGQPVSVIMNMSFKELEPIYDSDYQSNIDVSRLANNKQLQDLYPISDEDVGY